MAALRPDHDLTDDDAITHFSVYYSKSRRCSLCVTPTIVRRRVNQKWKQAAAEDQPFTVEDAKQVISERCGGCGLKGWPKVSLEKGILWLHVASSDRRKLK